MNTTMPNTVLSTGGEWLEMGMREQATKKVKGRSCSRLAGNVTASVQGKK